MDGEYPGRGSDGAGRHPDVYGSIDTCHLYKDEGKVSGGVSSFTQAHADIDGWTRQEVESGGRARRAGDGALT